ncbi:hypothetical protein Bhyg_11249 [Pseudolycoriella hygida]|uniref:Uncharacterized protein n=1 Tax=Pseudolycoriella hygida TaxID=35572 RepID=A0A9Q0MV27_9DIPT|nr:hypothetical protein Bhyg_11249 [Pseudolycoriella hygida]
MVHCLTLRVNANIASINGTEKHFKRRKEKLFMQSQTKQKKEKYHINIRLFACHFPGIPYLDVVPINAKDRKSNVMWLMLKFQSKQPSNETYVRQCVQPSHYTPNDKKLR